MSHATPLPPALTAKGVRIVRPRDGADTYYNPTANFRRLVEAGLLIRVARGYYAIPPRDAVSSTGWRPTPEAVALGIGIADYGRDSVALSGISAARVLGVLPRAIAAAVISAPVRRPRVNTIVGPVEFWHRDIADVETRKARTELATGWSTTAPQTLVDLADRPSLAGVDPSTVSETMWDLAPRVDWTEVHRISEKRRRRAAYARAVWVCAGLVADAVPPPRRGRPVPAKGLQSWSKADPSVFGISND
ncbi:MAG: type IV toxin-antitoxin system AbiEi family antitoxin domain-containing protein [Acidobacteria bacterium]|nr:type IV toxin-antitoxin system AbiEi family antitoxin domain-containing protein [Acidobacteriota bacterium]